MTKEEIARINELAKKKKTEGLSNQELNEQKELHSRYIEEYKENVRATLKNVKIKNEDGSIQALKKKNK